MPTEHTDPVCDMQVEEQNAAGSSDYKGETYYFCGQGCKKKFDESPEAYAGEAGVE
ncbi:MAG: YHS domain-containing protein [Pyrinomonadaceae bacterium]